MITAESRPHGHRENDGLIVRVGIILHNFEQKKIVNRVWLTIKKIYHVGV